MLCKDTKIRISLKKLLEDPWICQGKELSEQRKKCTEEESFKYYSLIQPLSLKIFDEVQKRSLSASPKSDKKTSPSTSPNP